VLEVGFRGRPLNGLKINLSDNMKGFIVNEIKNESDSKEKEFKIESTFDHLYSWQLDEPKLTKETESFNKAMNDWFAISSIVILFFLIFILKNTKKYLI
jgi:hypothetical protein